MTLAESVTYAIHLLFAGLWTGTVLFAAATLPSIERNLSGHVREVFVSRLKQISRASAVVLLLTGGYMLSLAGYTEGGTLTGSGEGHLVLAMAVLWFVLAGVVEAAASRLSDGEDADALLYAAGVVAVLLLLDAGVLLTSGF